MSRYDTTPMKVLDTASRNVIDHIVKYEVGAEASLRYLRTADRDVVRKLWVDFTDEFQKDHNTYPSGQTPDPAEKQLFHAKCRGFYFDTASRPPRPLIDYIKMAFAMFAGLQDLYLDIMFHADGEEIGCRARASVMGIFEARGWIAAPTTEANSRDSSNRKFWSLFDTTVYCRDESGAAVNYMVIDCGNSTLDGNYCKLQDSQGRVKTLTEDELEKIRIK